MKTLVSSPRIPHLPRRQQGVVLFIALIVLVAMTLAGLAMMRQVGTGVGIAGNLAFRQGATSAGDYGVEIGTNWLAGFKNSGLSLPSTEQAIGGATPGYFYSNWSGQSNNGGPAAFDPTTFNWSAVPVALNSDSAGNEIRYVVHRMCMLKDIAVNGRDSSNTGQVCATVPAQVGGSSTTTKSASGYLTNSTVPYYRVTVRALGPRGTISYIQVLLR